MDSPPHPLNWNRLCQKAAVGLFGLGVAIVFLLPADWLIGSAQADLGRQFLAWRAFAAASLRAGHWPLWNPYTYAGEPFLTGFQSAVFYPLNWIFLVFPLCRAVNLSLLIHAFVLAGGMYRWTRQRGFHPAAAALCGFTLPLCGPVFPQLYAGHLSNICTLAWAPWVFAGLEQWYGRAERRGLLLAAGAVAFQILAGHVQYVFYGAVAAVLHAALFSLARPDINRPVTRNRLTGWRIWSGLPAVYLLGAALAGAQLLPGWEAAGEGLRQGGLDAATAGMFSFPPENLLTAVAPGFFGDPIRHLYWGRCFPWEMSLFVGVSGCLLAAVAAFDPVARRSVWLDLAIATLLLVLALGRYTPLFRPLFEFGPGFDAFRGWSKFTFPAVLFLILAMGKGADVLFHQGRPTRLIGVVGIAGGAAALICGVILASKPSLLAPLFTSVRHSGESYLPAATFSDPAILRAATAHAAQSLVIAGALALLSGALLAGSHLYPRLAMTLLVLWPAEMLAFAASQFASFHERDASQPDVSAFVAAHPGDYRIQDLMAPNNGFLIGAPDIWGDDATVLRRYAEFISFSQQEDPDLTRQSVTFRALPPIYSLLRLRYIFSRPNGALKVFEVSNPLDRVQLLSEYQVLSDRKALFARMTAPDFDPRKMVLLDHEPSPRPETGPQGRVHVVEHSDNTLTIEADISAPSLLLITDPYSRDWHARPLSGSSQRRYETMAADYVVRATPLAAGHHHIQFYYEPSGLVAGLWVSALAWVGYAGCWICFSRRM